MDRVVILSPDDGLRAELARSLEGEMLRVQAVQKTAEALSLLDDSDVPVLLLEMFLNEQSGFSFCRATRENPATMRVPLVMLTRSDTEMDRVLGFEAGADDVIAWPCSSRELALRLRALLRRARRSAGTASDLPQPVSVEALTIDTARRQVKAEGRLVCLTPSEFDILALLATRPGRVFTRSEILHAVWGAGEARTLRVVDTHVRGIRRKLGKSGRLVETVWSVGYRLGDGRNRPPLYDENS